ncbi:DegT/DnrJ/EryC1/StrS family aminotransferase [Haloferula sp.]|uniref:DegT/DnrJ/EryC1/StrS family aminotransferase n=1 Tax=Haloferula sp. TaxID=2497595 RepID=UPI0032A12DC1
MSVPFLDLQAQHATHQDDYLQAITEVIESGRFADGPAVESFERDFAEYCGTRFAIGVGSGTEALWLSLVAAGIGPGDEVITVPNTFIATVEAIVFAGATPVFTDVDEKTLLMDPVRLRESITPRTKAVIPVHLFGAVADMAEINEVAQHHGLRVIEDAAQAHGARSGGRLAGNLGDVGCFSFYPGKNLGAFGDAGAVTTNDEILNERVRMLRQHGQKEKNRHLAVGWNCRMDDIQAAVLRVKLRHLDSWNDHRRALADAYGKAFSGVNEVILPVEPEGTRHVHHVFAIRVPSRDRVMAELARKSISCSIHYPTPIHRQEAFAHLELGEGSFPVSEHSATELLSLPIHPQMSFDEVEFTADAVKRALGAPVAA